MAALVLAQHSTSPAERLKDAAAVAFIALLLGIPMIGLTTVDQGGALRIATRWPTLCIFVGVCFAGRLLLRYAIDRLRARKQARDRSAVSAPTVDQATSPLLTWIGWAALGISVALPMLFSENRYVVDTATTVLIYVMLGWGLNVVVGLAGLLDLGYVAFYAVGAYTYGLLSTQFGWGFWQALPLAGAVAASFGILLGWPTLRLRGDYLAIVTLGFGEIIRIILVNWTELSGGPNGIASIPRPSFFGLPFKPPGDDPTFASFFGLEFSTNHRIVFLYYLILALALLTNLFVSRMRKLPIGRAWEAIREDEMPARRWESMRATSSSRRSPSAPCSAASPASSSPPARASSRRSPSPSTSRRSFSRSSCSAAWAASSVSSSPRWYWFSCLNWDATLPNTGCCSSARR